MGVLITSHARAGLDGLGAVAGLLALHPGARVWLPRSRRPEVRAVLEAGLFDAPALRLEDLDPGWLDLLILVGTRTLDRCGPLRRHLAGRPEPRLLTFPRRAQVPGGPGGRGRQPGATSTLVTDLLRQRGGGLPPHAATLLILGIFSATGRLLDPATTPEDIGAVAHLLGCGADLLQVNRFLQPTTTGERPPPAQESRIEPALTQMRRHWSARTLALIDQVSDLAGERRERVYLVGGVVRDLLLGRPGGDLDLLVEGEVLGFARELAVRAGGSCRENPAFGTATVRLPPDRHVDLAAARTETYPEPGALPRVTPGTLPQDLFRRDFTVNTLALPLGGDRRGRLVDLFGGRRDLQRRTLCILHRRSFLDDPTRAYRGVQLAMRRGLSLDRTAERCLRDAVRRGTVRRLSGARIFRELRAVLDHPRPSRTLARLHRYGLLSAADPALAWGRRADRRIRRLEGILRWYRRPGRQERSARPRQDVLLLMALTEGRDAGRRGALAERFALTGRERDLLIGFDVPLRRLVRRLGRRDRPPGPASIFFACQDRPLELLLFALAKTGRRPVRRAIVRYLDQLAGTALDIGGDDLVRAGMAPGPALGRALRRTLAARLEGKVHGRREELAWALRLARRDRRRRGREATEGDSHA